MILPYGAGGVPGRGEIPMSSVSSRTLVDFLLRIWGDEIELNATTKAQDTLPVFWWIKRSKSNKKEEKRNAKL